MKWLPMEEFGSEAAFRANAQQALSRWFHIQTEVTGMHCSGTPLRIDAVLQLRDNPALRFGVEFKNPSGLASLGDRAAWAAQAADYVHTEWEGQGRLVVATCPPITLSFDHYGSSDLPILAHLFGKFFVGELGISEYEGWALRMSGRTLWSQRYGARRNVSVTPKVGAR